LPAESEIMKLLLILALLSGPLALSADGREVEFDGSFLDWVVDLNVNHGVKVGVDPFELQNPELTKIRSFRSGAERDTEAFVVARAEKLCLVMKKGSGGAYYATSTMAAERDRRLSLFAKRDYEALVKTGDRADALVKVSDLIIRARGHSRQRAGQIRASSKEAGRAYSQVQPRVMTMKKNGVERTSAKEFSAVYREVEKLSTLIQGEVDRINTDYSNYLSAEESGGAFEGLILDYGSLALAGRAYLEYMVYRIAPVALGIKEMDPYYGCAWAQDGNNIKVTDPGTFESRFQPEIKANLEKRDREVKELGRAIEKALAETEGLADVAANSWKKGNHELAYAEISRVMESGDFSSRTRALHGIFFTDARSAFVVKAKKRAAAPARVGLEAMVGIGDGFVETFEAAFPGVLVGASRVSAVKHPGRRGACYGLTVSKEAGQVSTFGIQLRPRSSGDIEGGLISNGAQQIEVNSVGLGMLDEYMVASIRDALGYVSGNHDPKLFDQRVVVLFDSSVNIAYGGDSAGAALAAAAMSQSSGTVPAPDVCMTGALRAFGDIRPVGGIQQKAAAAREEGFRVMLAPAGNEAVWSMMPFSERVGPCQIVLGATMADYLPFALPEFEGVDSRPRRSLEAYAFAYHLFQAGQLASSLGCCERALDYCPNHHSARALAVVLGIAGVKATPVPEAVAAYLDRADPLDAGRAQIVEAAGSNGNGPDG